MAIRDVTGKYYLEARQTYNKWASLQRKPKSFKRWMRENVGVASKKFTSVREAKLNST
jgi:hypothetical protein